MYGITAAVTGFNPAGQLQVTVAIGRGMLDGSWHTVWLDLDEAVMAAVDVFDEIDDADKQDWCMASACAVAVSGQMFRLDNLTFRVGAHVIMDLPDLFEPGPLYAQIFEPYRYLFIADYAGARLDVHRHGKPPLPCENITDLMLDPEIFITDPNEIEDIWINEYGADPNLFGEIDPNVSLLFDPDGKRDFIVDINLPIFANPNLRVGGICAKRIISQGTLGWNSTIGGYGANGIQAFLLQPLPVNPYDGMPTYIPAYYSSLKAIIKYGKPHYNPALVFILESALWNAGMTVWPNIAAIDYTPQYFEDMIVTLEVTNGVHSDVRTFPISVVNYPVENYPPVVQIDIDDQIFYVGEPIDIDEPTNVYVISFIDPDCFIFSMSPAPATTHVPGFPISSNFRTDMDELSFQMTINGMSAYQYGPWIEKIIDPCSGLISFSPKFEGAFDTVVTCSDARGGIALGEITIFAINRGTWLNHPPVVMGGPTNPVVVKAGEEVVIHYPTINIADPDGDEIYASVNIGSVGRGPGGHIFWTFQSNFPGFYDVELIVYDIRGGYAILWWPLEVKPWWSY
jgi:hypothetical protein